MKQRCSWKLLGAGQPNPRLQRTPLRAPLSRKPLGVREGPRLLKYGLWSAPIIAILTLAATPHPSPTPIVYRVGGDVKTPVLVKKVDPHFRQDHVEHQLGVLIVEAIIGSSGKLRDLKVLRGPTNSFTREALAAIRQWEYKPATRKGVPVDVYIVITVNHFPMEPDA